MTLMPAVAMLEPGRVGKSGIVQNGERTVSVREAAGRRNRVIHVYMWDVLAVGDLHYVPRRGPMLRSLVLDSS